MAEELTHDLMPRHEKLTEAEAQQILDRYHVSPLELPKISKKDPGITHLDVKTGDIIKITRASDTAGSAIYYRVVINA
jgi:DNA-directed RNA polymerase subunit H